MEGEYIYFEATNFPRVNNKTFHMNKNHVNAKIIWKISSISDLHAKVTFRLCLSFFPRVETRFNTHYQNAYANAFHELLRLSSNSIASTSREEGLVTAQLHCAVWPVEHRSCRAHASRSVGDIKAFQNNFAFITCTEMCFWLKRVSDRTFFLHFRKAFLTP